MDTLVNVKYHVSSGSSSSFHRNLWCSLITSMSLLSLELEIDLSFLQDNLILNQNSKWNLCKWKIDGKKSFF